MKGILGFLLIIGVVYYIIDTADKNARFDPFLIEMANEYGHILKAEGLDVSEAESLMILAFADFASDENVGLTNHGNHLIYINDDIRNDTVLVKAVLWHELGHYIFGLEHGDCTLMESETSPTIFYKENWAELQKEYIQECKNVSGI